MKTIPGSIFLAACMTAGSGLLPALAMEDDAKDCVTRPEMGRNPNCRDGNAFRVHNRCDRPVDVKICIFTTKGKWDCGASWGIAPGHSWSYPSCFGTNNVMYDARPAGSNRRFDKPEQ